MKDFWTLAREMLRFRGLLAIGLVAALLDAATAFAGFGLLRVVITNTFGDPPEEMRGVIHAMLTDPDPVS